MNFAPGIPEYIARAEALFPAKLETASLAEKRAGYTALCQAFDGPRPVEIEVSNLAAPGPAGEVPLRLYRPHAPLPVPMLLFMHGGGFVVGGLDSHDGICADLAHGLKAAVLAVDYRLVPEHRSPAPEDDCWMALLHAVGRSSELGIDPERIVVGGDSAGGNLAAGLCLRARVEGSPRLAGQALIYPCLGLEVAAPERFQTGDAPGITRAGMIAYRKLQLGEAWEDADPVSVPLLAKGFEGLPPAYVIAMEFDPLRDDAEVYAERLGKDGVACDFTVWPGLIHGSLRARHSCPAAGAAFAHIVAGTRALMDREPNV